MADVMLQASPWLLESNPRLQAAVPGCGEHAYETDTVELAARCPRQVATEVGYTEVHAHLLHAGTGILPYGSRFESCGPTPLYSICYGTVLVTSCIGGLMGTITDRGSPEAALYGAMGFLFGGDTTDAMVAAAKHALHVSAQPQAWRILQYNGMMTDFGWLQPAREHIVLYRTLMPAATLMLAVALVQALVVSDAVHTPRPEQPVRTSARRRSTALSDETRTHAMTYATSAEKIRTWPRLTPYPAFTHVRDQVV